MIKLDGDGDGDGDGIGTCKDTLKAGIFMSDAVFAQYFYMKLAIGMIGVITKYLNVFPSNYKCCVKLHLNLTLYESSNLTGRSNTHDPVPLNTDIVLCKFYFFPILNIWNV